MAKIFCLPGLGVSFFSMHSYKFLKVRMAKSKKAALRRRFLISLVIVVIILLAIVFLLRENLAGMADALSRANYGLVAVAVGIYLTGILFWAARWRISLSAVGYPKRLRDIYLVIFGGMFLANITPLTYAGGDPIARSYLIKKTQRVPYSAGFASIAMEILLDLPVFLSFMMVGLLTSIYASSVLVVLIITGVWMATVVTILVILLHFFSRKVGAEKIKAFAERVFRTFRLRLKKTAVSGGVDNFYRGAHSVMSRWRAAASMSTFSAFIWTFSMIRLFIVLQALNYPSVPISMLMLAATLPTIAGLLSLLPAGIGIIDATMISVLAFFGVPVEIAASATLIDRAITLAFSSLCGAGVVSYLGIKHGRVTGTKAKRRAQ